MADEVPGGSARTLDAAADDQRAASRGILPYMSARSDIEDMLDRCEVECLHPDHVAPLVGRVLASASADQVAATFSILADTTRARILHALTLADELCVCDMAFLLGVSQSALSHQLGLLRENRVVSRRKAGRIAYYRLADEHIRHIFLDGARHTLDETAASLAV